MVVTRLVLSLLDFLLVILAGLGDKDSVVLAYNYAAAASSACRSDLRAHGMITLYITMICCARVVTQLRALTKSVMLRRFRFLRRCALHGGVEY